MGGCDSKEKDELVDVEDDEYYKEVLAASVTLRAHALLARLLI